MYTLLMCTQVAEKIRVDPRVTVIERTNLRYLEGLPEQVDLVTLDLAFISILLVQLGTHLHCSSRYNCFLYLVCI